MINETQNLMMEKAEEGNLTGDDDEEGEEEDEDVDDDEGDDDDKVEKHIRYYFNKQFLNEVTLFL